MVVIALLLFVIVCELAAIYDRQRLQKGVFSSLANAAGHIGALYADFVQSDEVRNSMKATADKAIECMDNIKELNELEEQLKAEEQESEGED